MISKTTLGFLALASVVQLFAGASDHSIGHYGNHTHQPPCRFAKQWSQKEVLSDPDGFLWDLLYWEGKFHQNNVSYNTGNAMSYDGTQLDWITGKRTLKHNFSAASKESLQVMLYARAINGSQEAARFLTPNNPSQAPQFAASIMATKLETYLAFNQTYPGFGGFLPWVNTNTQAISPASGWVNLVPGLDNGELLWAVYACIEALEGHSDPSLQSLAQKWNQWFEYVTSTAAQVFYQGNGKVCAVTAIGNQSLPINHPNQTYACQTDSYLDDPYEGELMTYFLSLLGGLTEQDIAELWARKKPNHKAVTYNKGGVGPITVEEGFWFSAHELWKLLELPYNDVDLVRQVEYNAERARTCNSVVRKIPGLYASVNNSTDVQNNTIISYISAAGIPSIASQKDQYLEVVTPYGAWHTIMVNKTVGLAWWRDMVSSQKMQNPYGSTESTRIDGELVSALVTWDSKITTVMGILGGVSDLVRVRMKKDKIYQPFIKAVTKDYSSVFGQLKGMNIGLCLPQESVPDVGLKDFTLCEVQS